MLKKCTPLWREAHFEVTLHYTTVHSSTKQQQQQLQLQLQQLQQQLLLQLHYTTTTTTQQLQLPVVPHKAVAEVSKIGNL